MYGSMQRSFAAFVPYFFEMISCCNQQQPADVHAQAFSIGYLKICVCCFHICDRLTLNLMLSAVAGSRLLSGRSAPGVAPVS